MRPVADIEDHGVRAWLDAGVHAVRRVVGQIEVVPRDRRSRAAAGAASCSRMMRSSVARIRLARDRFDVGEADGGQQRQDQAAILGQAGAARLPSGRRSRWLRDAGELIGEAARVGLVEQQQIEHQRAASDRGGSASGR